MFPLRDNIGTNRFPIVTAALIVACTLIFLFEISRPATTLPGYQTGIQRSVSGFDRVTAEWGFVPCELVHRCRYPGRADLSSPDGGTAEVRVAQHAAWLTLFASIFMHGGWLHIVGNMLFLWIFGNNVEDRMGRFRYLLFYLVCGLVAALTQLATDPSSGVPNIGASGAIAGVLGAYIVLYPRARVLTAIIAARVLRDRRGSRDHPARRLVPATGARRVSRAGLRRAREASPTSRTSGGFVAGLLLVWPLVRGRPRRALPT